MEAIRFELKYCERCGTLKLRQVASESTYCRRCESLLERFTFHRSTGVTNFSALPASPAPRMLAGIPPTAVNDRLAGRAQ
jgi:hypothetical protein